MTTPTLAKKGRIFQESSIIGSLIKWEASASKSVTAIRGNVLRMFGPIVASLGEQLHASQ